MVSLAEDVYLEEALFGEPETKQEKTVKRWKRSSFAGAAAVIAVAVLAGGMFAGLRTRTHQSLEPERPTGVRVADLTTEADTEYEQVDYQAYFSKVFDEKGSKSRLALDYTLSLGGAEYRYEGADSLSGLPFSIDGFSTAEASVYYDKEEQWANTLLYFADDAAQKHLTITISGKGNFYSCFAIDEDEGVERFGTMVYGFDLSAFSSEEIYLEMYFRREGLGYGITSTGLSYEEMGKIMDNILTKGLNGTEFDRSHAVKCTKEIFRMSLEEACALPSFAGFVPQIYEVGSLSVSQQTGGNAVVRGGTDCSYHVSYENGEVADENLDICYENGNYAYIIADFHSGSVPEYKKDVILLRELNEESILLYEYSSDREGAHWYSFTVADENRYVCISANCTREEILGYMKGFYQN